MTPIKFHVIPRGIVEEITKDNPVPSELLDKYLASRPGILNDHQCDIFCQNFRSRNQYWQRFDLFEEVENCQRDTLIVFPTWLELFLAGNVRQNIQKCIDAVISWYPNNPICFQWNHDQDASAMPEFRNLPERVFVLQFNTSKPTPNDILLPFWAIATNRQPVIKQYFAGFAGYVGSILVRQRLAKAIREKSGYYFQRDRIPEEQWLNLLGSFRFALCPRGGGLSSYRFYEAIQCGSIPALFGDDAALPYPDLIYSDFSLRLPEAIAGDFNLINQCLQEAKEWEMTCKILEVRERFSLAGVQQEIHKRIWEYLR